MFYVYILKSEIKPMHYIGHAEDLDERLKQHNRGAVKVTKNFRPWKIIYSETFNTRSEAFRREFEIKSYKGGIKFKKLLNLL